MLLEYLLAFGLGLAPSVIWLVFFELEEDEHSEPIGGLVYAFMVGGITTFAALIIQLVLLPYFRTNGISAHDLFGVSIFATIEEILKFAAVYLLVSRRTSFNEPLHAMIYMITAALGFAAVENIASLINQGTLQQTTLSVAAVETIVLRFLGATLLHTATSGIVGFHWAVGWVRGKYLWLHIAAGLLIASVLHAIFNYLIIKTGPASWGLAFVVFIALLVLIDFEELRTEDEREHANVMKAAQNTILK